MFLSNFTRTMQITVRKKIVAKLEVEILNFMAKISSEKYEVANSLSGSSTFFGGFFSQIDLPRLNFSPLF